MKGYVYRVIYSETGAFVTEDVHVSARDLNSGYVKALKIAREPLGNGRVREIARIEFLKRVS